MDLSPQDVALASTLFDDVLDLGPPDIEVRITRVEVSLGRM